MSISGSPLPTALVLGVIAALAYLILCPGRRRGGFSVLDACVIVAVMALVPAASMTFLDAADNAAKSTVLKENLRVLRAQIALYKLQHEGKVPLLYEGTLPQLTKATNADGVPGPRGKDFPYGPYLPAGIPVNPEVGLRLVEATDTYPPTSAGKGCGWLYHQETGQIAPNLRESPSRLGQPAEESSR